MSLMEAPEYDARGENRRRNLMIGVGVLFAVCLVTAFAGLFMGHGWFFSNLYAEHRVDRFLTAVEQKDFAKAYGIYTNDEAWQQHPEKHKAYPLERFTEDWTEYTVKGGIHSHHVDKSITDGSGTFGSGILVGSHVNGGDRKLFIYYLRKDGTLNEPQHEFAY